MLMEMFCKDCAIARPVEIMTIIAHTHAIERIAHCGIFSASALQCTTIVFLASNIVVMDPESLKMYIFRRFHSRSCAS